MWWQSPPMQALKSEEMARQREACCQPSCLVQLFLPLQPLKAPLWIGWGEGVLGQCCVARMEQDCCLPCPPRANAHCRSLVRLQCIPKKREDQRMPLGQAGRAHPAAFAASLPPKPAVDERHRRLDLSKGSKAL